MRTLLALSILAVGCARHEAMRPYSGPKRAGYSIFVLGHSSDGISVTCNGRLVFSGPIPRTGESPQLLQLGVPTVDGVAQSIEVRSSRTKMSAHFEWGTYNAVVLVLKDEAVDFRLADSPKFE